jgi:HK97 family phage portal protein
MGRAGEGGLTAQRLWARLTTPLKLGQRAMVPMGNVRLVSSLNDPADTLKIATVYRCVTLISQSIAMLPWGVYKRSDNDVGERARQSPVEWLLHSEASPELTAYEFRRLLITHMLLYGNGYAEIERDNSNRPFALHPIDPTRVTPGRNAAGELVYAVRQAGGEAITLPARSVFHVRGTSLDGIVGMSILDVAASSLSTSVALDESLWRFFLTGFRPLGFLKTKGKLGLEGFKALEQRLDEYSGLNKRWKAIPLDQDMDFQPLAVSPEDAQLVDMRKFSAIEVCRWFGVPPHMAYDLERATFSNIESQGRDFLTYGLMPHITQLEQEANRKLLSSSFGGLYSKINVNAIVRGDMGARGAFYQQMRNMGVVSVNEIRAWEDMPTIGPEGDVRVMQAQYQSTGQQQPPADPPPPEATAQ